MNNPLVKTVKFPQRTGFFKAACVGAFIVNALTMTTFGWQAPMVEMFMMLGFVVLVAAFRFGFMNNTLFSLGSGIPGLGALIGLWPHIDQFMVPVAQAVILTALVYAWGKQVPEKWKKAAKEIEGGSSNGYVNEDTSLGSARWGTIQEAVDKRRVLPNGLGIAESNGLAVGRTQDVSGYDNRLRWQGHILTLAPTGAGKFRNVVAPNLLMYPGSVFVNDIKGEAYQQTMGYRRAELQQTIAVFDPFGEVVMGLGSAQLNPIDWLRKYPDDLKTNAWNLAQAMVFRDGRGDPHWNESTINMIQAFLIFLALVPEKHIESRSNVGDIDGFVESGGNRQLLRARDMGQLRRFFNMGMEDFRKVCKLMQTIDHPAVEDAGHGYLDMNEKELSFIITNGRKHLDFLAEPKILKSFEVTTCEIDDLNARPTSVYVVLPPDKVEPFGKYMRILATIAVNGITQNRRKPEHNTLFLFDEFGKLGKFDLIEDKISIIRSYGAYFWIFVQDLSQIKAVYEKWQTFTANAALQVFNVQDIDTAKMVSETLGTFTQTVQSHGVSSGVSSTLPGDGMISRLLGERTYQQGQSIQVSQQERNLLNPDEILTLPKDVVIFRAGNDRPWKLRKIDYLVDEQYRGLSPAFPKFRGQ